MREPVTTPERTAFCAERLIPTDIQAVQTPERTRHPAERAIRSVVGATRSVAERHHPAERASCSAERKACFPGYRARSTERGGRSAGWRLCFVEQSVRSAEQMAQRERAQGTMVLNNAPTCEDLRMLKGWLCSLLVLAGACSAPAEAPGPAAPSMLEYRSPDGAYSFTYPAGWSVEAVNEGDLDGTLLMAPEMEGGWQANLFFSVDPDPGAGPLSQELNEFAANLRGVKPDFQLVGIDTVPVANASAGRIIFNHTDAGTRLLAWELIVPAADGASRVAVSASMADALKDKYLPIFEKVVGSLKLGI